MVISTSYFKDKVLYPRAFSDLRELNNTQWSSAETQVKRKLEAFQKLVSFAYQEVPYYREIFLQHRLDPRNFKSLEDVSKIPFLTKDAISRNFKKMISAKGRAYLKITSSGSTASPLTVLRDKRCHERILAARWRALGWWGISPHQRSAQIWGKPISQLRKGNRPVTKSLLKNCLFLSAFEMSENTLPEYIAAIATYKPVYIFGYASSLYRLACFILDSGATKKLKSIKLVVSSAEMLFPNQRKVIEEAFKCRVANFYNASEVGLIAAECPDKSMHLTAENMLLEFVSCDSVFFGGYNLCLTQLFNYKLPLIRYKMDDILEISDEHCSCGRNLPVIKKIHGREFDLFISKDGRYIHGAFFCYLMDNAGGVKFYKIIQKELSYIQCFILKVDSVQEVNTKYIVENIEFLMGSQTRVEFIFVNRIEEMPVDATGKYKYVSTEVR